MRGTDMRRATLVVANVEEVRALMAKASNAGKTGSGALGIAQVETCVNRMPAADRPTYEAVMLQRVTDSTGAESFECASTRDFNHNLLKRRMPEIWATCKMHSLRPAQQPSQPAVTAADPIGIRVQLGGDDEGNGDNGHDEDDDGDHDGDPAANHHPLVTIPNTSSNNAAPDQPRTYVSAFRAAVAPFIPMPRTTVTLLRKLNSNAATRLRRDQGGDNAATLVPGYFRKLNNMTHAQVVDMHEQFTRALGDEVSSEAFEVGLWLADLLDRPFSFMTRLRADALVHDDTVPVLAATWAAPQPAAPLIDAPVPPHAAMPLAEPPPPVAPPLPAALPLGAPPSHVVSQPSAATLPQQLAASSSDDSDTSTSDSDHDDETLARYAAAAATKRVLGIDVRDADDEGQPMSRSRRRRIGSDDASSTTTALLVGGVGGDDALTQDSRRNTTAPLFMQAVALLPDATQSLIWRIIESTSLAQSDKITQIRAIIHQHKSQASQRPPQRAAAATAAAALVSDTAASATSIFDRHPAAFAGA